MGKLYAKVVNASPVETKTRKDGSGTYPIAFVDLQPYDVDGQPMTHIYYDPETGAARTIADMVRYDAIHEKAQELASMNYQPGETVVIDLSLRVNQYGRVDSKVVKLERYQQPQPQQQFQQHNNLPFG